MKISSAVFGAFWILLALYSFLNYFSAPFAYPLWSSALFIIAAWSVFSLGRRLTSFIIPGGDNFFLEAALAGGAGLAALSYLTLALGFFGLLYPWAAALALALMLICGKRYPFTAPAAGIRSCRLLPAAAVLLTAFLVSWVPVHQYDSLVYHMALPQVYALRHGISAIQENMYSHFPQNAEMLFTFSLLLNSDILAQLMTWFSLALSLLWIYSLKGRFSEETVGLAAFLAVTHTSLWVLSSTTYIESFVTLWITAAVISLAKWSEAGALEKRAWSWAVLAGISAGTALGTKYYAGICVVFIFIAGLLRIFSEKEGPERKARFLQLAACSGMMLILFAPWAVKNIVETGNPVFPFLCGVFPPGKTAAGLEQAQKYLGEFSREYGSGGNFIRGLLEFPRLTLTNPSRYGGGIDILGGLGWELVFASVPLMFLSALKNKRSRLFAFYLLFHWAAWFMTGRVLRFLVVTVPLSAVLSADGFMILRESSGKRLKAALYSGLAVFIALRVLLFSYVQHIFEAPSVVLGIKGRGEYLSQKLYYYPCAKAASRLTPENSKLLFAGEQRTYYSARESFPTSVFNANGFVAAANNASGWEELAQSLSSAGFTHVLFVPKEAGRLQPYGTLGFSEKGMKNWKEFSGQALEVTYKTPECYLYRIKR